MNKAQNLIIRNECIKFAADQGMDIKTLNETTFHAEDDESIVLTEISHLYQQFQQGHTVQETLQNETNCRGGDYRDTW